VSARVVEASATRRAPLVLVERADLFAAAALGFIAAGVVYVAGRGLSFFFDEWNFVLDRRGESVGTYLDSHNGHLSVVPIAIYKALFVLVGLEHYGPYRLTAIALHLACAAFLFLLVRRRVPPLAAFLALAVALFLGRAWEDLLWPFQIGYFSAVAGGLGAFFFLDRDFGRRGDVAVCLLLAFSLGASGLGIAFWVGAAVAFLLRRRPFVRAWCLVVPLGLYLLWYARYGSNTALASNVPKLPAYVYDSYAGAVGAICGLGLGPGRVIGAVLLFGVAGIAVSERSRVLDALVPASAALAFWVLTGLTRAQYHEPASSRYLYPGAFLVLLAAADLLSPYTLPRWLLPTLVPLAALAIGANLVNLREGAWSMRGWDASVDASLAVLELERPLAPADFKPSPAYAPQVTADRYFATTAQLGSPALPLSLLPGQAPQVRLDADATLARLVLPSALSRGASASGSHAPTLEGFGAGRLERAGGCDVFVPRAGQGPPAVDLAVPARGLILRSSRPVSLYLRRLADYPSQPTTLLGAGAFMLRLPHDALAFPWHVRLSPTATLTACAAR
jgi:hypothetical protein